MRVTPAAWLLITTFTLFASSALAGESSQYSSETVKRQIPFLLCQNSINPAGVGSLLRASHEWKMDGIELNLEQVIKEAGGRDNLSIHLAKIPGEMLQDKYVHLTAISSSTSADSMVDDIVALTNHLQIKSCSVVTPELGVKLLEKLPTLPILIENGDIVSGVAVDRFLGQIRQTPEPIGVLIKSSAVRYRFDLCLTDVWQKMGATPIRPLAVRFRCDTGQVHNSSIAEFNREMFRRSLAHRIQPSGIQQLFVSIEATKPLSVEKSLSPEFETMHDMIEVLRNELMVSQ